MPEITGFLLDLFLIFLAAKVAAEPCGLPTTAFFRWRVFGWT